MDASRIMPLICCLVLALAGCSSPEKKVSKPHKPSIRHKAINVVFNAPVTPTESQPKPQWVFVGRFTSQDLAKITNGSSATTCLTTKPYAIISWTRVDGVVPGSPFAIWASAPGETFSSNEGSRPTQSKNGFIALGQPGQYRISFLTHEHFAIEVYESSIAGRNPDEAPPTPTFSDMEVKTSADEDRIAALEQREREKQARLDALAWNLQHRADMNRQMRNQSLGGGGASVIEVH